MSSLLWAMFTSMWPCVSTLWSLWSLLSNVKMDETARIRNWPYVWEEDNREHNTENSKDHTAVHMVHTRMGSNMADSMVRSMESSKQEDSNPSCLVFD
ncbi:hypothetical protein NQ318_002103 [Aromia moschata]|uniref:Secreted protein n=1 Tax=Aromia moschata TaxID=1265417 RepID=A0AAV8Y782_9CUCU|nr:hypothetical protein NQ318_002103 [Aromia moschata]